MGKYSEGWTRCHLRGEDATHTRAPPEKGYKYIYCRADMREPDWCQFGCARTRAQVFENVSVGPAQRTESGRAGPVAVIKQSCADANARSRAHRQGTVR